MFNRTIHRYATEDSGAVLARFKNGALATVDTFFCIRDNSSKNRLELYGSRGSLLAQNTIGQGADGEMVAFLEEAGKEYEAKQTRSASGGMVIAPKPVNTYRTEIEEFSQALLDGRDTRESALRGLRSQIILEACYKSAKSGKVVRVSGV
jgi:predicted dehydrogenase